MVWDKTGVERTSGGSQFNAGSIHVIFEGTSNTAQSDVDISNLFGSNLTSEFGDVRTLNSAVIVIMKD